jgi:DNA-binding response OmpR family regulator
MAGDENRIPTKVLIVEDDSISRAALQWLLEDLGFAPVSVGDLAGAREYLSRITPEILILDLSLPDGDGTEILCEIRAAKRPIVVAVVTGITNTLKLHDVTALKPEALFGKPVDIDDFDDWLVKQLANFAMAASKTPDSQNAVA